MSPSLGRTYKQCKKCRDYIPRMIHDKIAKKSFINKRDICDECMEQQQGEEE